MRRPVVLCIVASNGLPAQPFFFRRDIPLTGLNAADQNPSNNTISDPPVLSLGRN